MQCTFKQGFDELKNEIINNSSKIMHLITLGDKLIFIEGIHHIIEGKPYLYVKNITPAVKNFLKHIEGIYYSENYLFKPYSEYEYIIRIDDVDKYKFSEPLCLEIDYEMNGKITKRKVFHSGYYQCGETLGLSFNSSGSVIGFLPNTYMNMLDGDEIYEEYRKGRWDKKYGSKTYRISGEQWVKDFIKMKNNLHM